MGNSSIKIEFRLLGAGLPPCDGDGVSASECVARSCGINDLYFAGRDQLAGLRLSMALVCLVVDALVTVS